MPAVGNCNGAVVITTQSSVVERRTLHSFQVDAFSEDEGAQSLLKYLKISDGNRNEAKEISSLVGGLPLALVQVAGYIQKSKASLGEFIASYKSRFISPSIWDSKDTYGKSLETVFDIALGSLRAADHDARDLLDILALFNPDQISEDIIFKLHSSACLARFSIDDSAR